MFRSSLPMESVSLPPPLHGNNRHHKLAQADEGGFEPTGPHPNFEGGWTLRDYFAKRSSHGAKVKLPRHSVGGSLSAWTCGLDAGLVLAAEWHELEPLCRCTETLS